MRKDNLTTTETLKQKPQSIRELYDAFRSEIGKGENPLFAHAPAGAVFKNMVGSEKPLLYVLDENGEVQQWLTAEELERRKEPELSDEQLFDMFSFMVGGRKPSLSELGVNDWSGLLISAPEEASPESLEKVRKLLEFVDSHPNSNLVEWLVSSLSLSEMRTQMFQATHRTQSGMVIVQGDTGWNRGKMFVWHPIRNARTSIHAFSPFRVDGAVQIGNINDVQVIYQTDEGVQVARLNKIVLLLAMHGMSEESTDQTSLDQVYMTPEQFVQNIYIEDEKVRREQQKIENENYVIQNKVANYLELITKRKSKMMLDLLDSADQGYLDEVVESIQE